MSRGELSFGKKPHRINVVARRHVDCVPPALNLTSTVDAPSSPSVVTRRRWKTRKSLPFLMDVLGWQYAILSDVAKHQPANPHSRPTRGECLAFLLGFESLIPHRIVHVRAKQHSFDVIKICICELDVTLGNLKGETPFRRLSGCSLERNKANIRREKERKVNEHASNGMEWNVQLCVGVCVQGCVCVCAKTSSLEGVRHTHLL